MDRYETGMLARSKAGHDAGSVYVITDTDDAYVYLVDGKLRTFSPYDLSKGRIIWRDK